MAASWASQGIHTGSSFAQSGPRSRRLFGRGETGGMRTTGSQWDGSQGTIADPVGPILGVQANEAEFVEAAMCM